MSELRDALRLIAAKGDSYLSSMAAKALLSKAKESQQMRFNMIAPVALERVDFTDNERELIAQNIRFSDETRDYTLRVRLTDAERFELESMADAGGQSLSEYVRNRLFDKSTS